MGEHPDYDDFEDADAVAPEQGLPTWMIILVCLSIPCFALIPLSLLAAVFIPNIQIDLKGGNEAAAIGSLRTMGTAQVLFREGDHDGDLVSEYGSLAELGSANLVDAVLASGQKQGYHFTCSPVPGNEPSQWWAMASPVEPGVTGDRWFFTDHTGIIRESLQPITVDPKTGHPAGKLQVTGR